MVLNRQKYKKGSKLCFCIRFIRAVDPDPHGSAFIFPPGSGVFKVNLHKLHCFLLLSNLLGFLQLKKTVHDFFSSNLVKLYLDLDLDPDPHSENLLDPDPRKMNADPQPWF